ncbi:MAG: hypothetical protein ACRDZ1_08405, partial [Acidimicrobiia bacterium]
MRDTGAPTPPISFSSAPELVGSRLATARVEVDGALLDRLRGVCASVTVDDGDVVEASRDWWPLAMIW